MPGLDNNPADDGMVFGKSHPYITKAYPGAEKAAVHHKGLSGRGKGGSQIFCVKSFPNGQNRIFQMSRLAKWMRNVLK